MIWTCLGCSFTLLLSFVMLVSTDNNSNNPDPLLLNANSSLIFLSELPLVRLRLFGQNLEALNEFNIRLYNPQCSCRIQVNVLNYSKNETNISLSATESTTTGIYHFVITTSSGNITSNLNIEVVLDPFVMDVMPKQVFSMGGIRLTIHGSGFNKSGDARIEVTDASKVPNESLTSQDCVSRTDSKMVCILPKLDEDAFVHKDQSRQWIGVSLLFKKKILPLPLVQAFNFTTQRPVFASPSGLFVYKQNKHSLLDISGSKILIGCSIEDYVVQLGSDECPITGASNDLITFAPPKSKPKSSADLDARFNCDQYNGAIPLLVRLGDPNNASLTFFIRCLTYEGSNELAFQLGLGLGVGLFLLLVLLAAVGMLIFLCLRYSNQKTKELAWEHNIKVVREFNQKKKEIENMVCIPVILQMTANIQEKNEMSPFGILENIASKNANHECKTDMTTSQQHKVTTTAEIVRSSAQDATSQDDFVEAQPSTSYEEMSNSEMNSYEEVSQNLLFPDSVAGKADVNNFLHKQIME